MPASAHRCNNTAILIHQTVLWRSTRSRCKMKWLCMLPLFFIFSVWALARTHPHDHEELVCNMTLACTPGVMMEFDTKEAANRVGRSILENKGGHGGDVSVPMISEESVNRDYAISDPSPVTRRPSKEPVHYRIFSGPPSASPIP